MRTDDVKRRGAIPWPIRGVLAGAAGTAAMTLAYKAEHAARPDVRGSLDYDDSLVPGPDRRLGAPSALRDGAR